MLKSEPPSNIPSELFWRRKIAQALSLCQSGKNQQAEEHFVQAAALHAEPGALNYARGRCARSQGHFKEAENYLRLVTAQSSNPDPFLKAYALGTMAALAGRDHRYDEELDLEKESFAIFRTLHAPPLEELVLGNLGDLYLKFADFKDALENAEAGEKIASELKDPSQLKFLVIIGIARSD